jgi:transcription antitermination factor NusG
MTTQVVGTRNPAKCPPQHSDADDLRWYAAYTRANREKKVTEQFEARSVEHFLPLYQSMRRWKDRSVQLLLPLFPGYVFVRLALYGRLQVLQIPGIVRLVGFSGHLSALQDMEIESLKNALNLGIRAEPHPFLAAGRRIRIKSGPLAGLEGVIIRRKNGLRFVISLHLINRSAAVEIEEADLEPA